MRVEEKVQIRARRRKIQNIVLGSLYTAGALGMVAMAPNSAQLLRYVEKYIGPKQRLDRRISQTITRLHQKGLIERVRTAKGTTLRLTEKGKARARSLEAGNASVRKPRRWDGKWRIVIFDIWERRRGVRDQLRTLLQRNEFVKIQNSVWVYPYDCEELFVFLRAELRLGKGILYIVAEEVENDKVLRRHFKLPLEY